MKRRARSVGVRRRLRFTHSLTARNREPGELSPLRHLSMGFLQRHPERARCELGLDSVAAASVGV